MLEILGTELTVFNLVVVRAVEETEVNNGENAVDAVVDWKDEDVATLVLLVDVEETENSVVETVEEDAIEESVSDSEVDDSVVEDTEEPMEEIEDNVEEIVDTAKAVALAVVNSVLFGATFGLISGRSASLRSSVVLTPPTGSPGGLRTNVCLAMMKSSCSVVSPNSDADRPNTSTNSWIIRT